MNNDINLLANKLKEALIQKLLQHPEQINEPYLLTRDKGPITKAQLARELKEETEFGLDYLSKIFVFSSIILNEHEVQPKYEYHLSTWGGFYNDEHKAKHGYEEGDYWFDSATEREMYIDKLKKVEKELNARVLMISTNEGFNTRVKTILHRVIEWEGKQYYSSRDMGYAYPYETAQYILHYKWYPGFNDYPLGEDFNYDNVEILEEWISGSFIEPIDYD